MLLQKKNNLYIIIAGMNRNEAYDSQEKIFRAACIYDYTYFIKSFFFIIIKKIKFMKK